MKNYTVKYSCIQGFYYAAYCALMGFGSVYLLGQGFSNSTIGVVFAITSIMGVFTQPLIASFADSHPKIELRTILSALGLAAIILSVVIFFLRGTSAIILCVFIGIVTSMVTMQPLTNALAFKFEQYGVQINYGLARGMGSAAYALVSIAVGYIVEWFGIYIIPMIYLVFNVLLVWVVYSMVIPKNQQNVVENKIEEKQLSLLEFSKKYKKYMIFVIGATFTFFTHILLNNFMIQIITPMGGTESQMGTAVFIAAMVELPGMFFIEKLQDRFGCSTILKFSLVMFVLKHAVVYLSSNMAIFYFAMVLQMISYGLYQPIIIYYANKVVASQDANKGQSMMTLASVGSGVLANLIGGILLDTISVSYVMLLGTLVTAIGMVISFMSIEKV